MSEESILFNKPQKLPVSGVFLYNVLGRMPIMSETNSQNRITWIDGLKGLACIGVFSHHFFLAFFTASYYGTDATSLLPGHFDQLLSYKPYGVLINGNFWVCMFIVLASFLPALQIMKAADDSVGNKLGSMVLKRYPRLMLPAFAVSFLNYAIVRGLYMVGLTSRLPAYGIEQLIIDGLFKTWIQMDITLQGPFWTLHYLLFVPLFAAMLATTDRKANRHMPFVFLIMFTFFIHTNSVYDYYLAGVIGVLLADIVYHQRFKWLQSKALAVIMVILLIIVGLWLGGFPSYGTPVESYEALGFILMYNNGGYAIYHCLGVLLILMGCLIWNQIGMPDILSVKAFKWLGKNCYSIFLIHALLIDYLGVPLMGYFNNTTGSIVIAAILTYIILLLVIFALAEVFNRTIEKWTGQICTRIKDERV